MNRQALAIAKSASEGDALVAGNICSTNIYGANNDAARQVRDVREQFRAVDAGVDFIVAETISYSAG